jgi:sec-independent protein translocase protein TatA
MGSMSLMHWLVVLAIVLVLFGAGKLPRVMGDFAKGIKAFKSGMKEEEETAETAPPPAQVTAPAPGTAPAATATVASRPHEHA